MLSNVVPETPRKKNNTPESLNDALINKLIKANIIGVIITEKDGTITHANDYFLHMIGYTRDELDKGKINWRDITPEKHLKSSEEKIIEMLKNGSAGPFMKEYITKAGKTIPVMLVMTLLNEQTQEEIDYILDLSETKRIEKRADIRIATLLNKASDAFFSYDNKWNFTFLNKKAEALLGKSRKQVIGKNIWEIFPRAVNSNFYKKYHEAVSTQQSISFEEFYQPLNRWLEFHLYPHKKGLFAYVQDRTERKFAEESNARLAAIVKYSDDAIFGKTLDGIVTSWNKGAEKIYGYTAEEIVGRHITTIFPEEKLPEFTKIMNTIKEGKSFEHYETERIRKDGVRLNVSITISPIMDNAGNLIGASTIARDITENKKIQQQLQLSASIIKSTSDAVIATGLDLKVAIWNKAAEELYGWTEEEMLGTRSTDYLKTTFPDGRSNWQAEIAETGYWKGEVYQVNKKGDRLVTLASVAEVKDNNGKTIGYVAINRDVTERKHQSDNLLFLANASKLLSSSLNYYQTLNSLANLAVPDFADWCSVEMLNGSGKSDQIAIAHKDPQKMKWAKELRKKRPLDMNAPYGLANVLRTKKSEIYPEITEEIVKASVKHEEDFEVIKNIGFTSAMIVPIVIRDKAIGAIQFVTTESRRHYNTHDLTIAEELAGHTALAIENVQLYEAAQKEIKVRTKAEETLQISEERFRRLFDSNLIGVAYWELDGYISNANQEYQRIVGYSIKELRKEKIGWENVTPHEYYDAQINAINQIKKFGVAPIFEKEYIRKDGSRIPVLIGMAGLKGTNNEAVAFLLDITERKRVEQRKDEFIGIASHELKTPLTSIKGYAQILERHIKKTGDTKALQYLSRSNIYIDRLNNLITDLLDVSKIQAGKLKFDMEEFDIDEMIQESIESIQPTTSQHTITKQGSINQKITGDKRRLDEVVTNLLSNAIKYSPKQGKIIVKVSKTDDEIEVSVKDFGIGISKDHQSKIFNRYYRVESDEKNFSGLGIGLYISNEIVKRHGGRMWVESKKNTGSTFIFTLPLKKHET